MPRRVSVVGTHADALLIDSDGLPHVGCPIWPGQPYYNAKETLTGSNKAGKLKGEETAIIEQVTVIGGGKGADIKQASIKMRFNRNPVIGAPSGAMSMKYPGMEVKGVPKECSVLCRR